MLLRAVARIRSLGLVARFTIIGATVGFLVAGGISLLVDARLTDLMLAQVASRAMDQVELGVLRSISAVDLETPYPPEKLADIAARLDPILDRVRQDGSGVVRLHVFAADGTVIYSDLPSKRGTVTSPDKSAGLANALSGSVATGISQLSSPESRELKERYGSALEVYVPFRIQGRVVGAYEIYQDLAPLRPLRPLVWTSVLGGFALLFLALLTIVRRAAASISRLASILEATTDYVAIADHRGRHIYLNGAARRMLGMSPEESIGRADMLDVRPDWARSFLTAEGIPVACRDGVWSGETAVVARDGSEIPVSEVLLTRKTVTGKIESYSTIARDITDRKEWEATLEHQALHDALTDLPNRALFDDRLKQAILAAQRDSRPLALLVMDLDRFKDVNDTLGHHHGDVMADASRAMEVLQQLRELGVHISIDDFGTGYSSLAYLKQLPVDELKIDKSFVLDMTANENDAAIVRATVELGHHLGLQVLAEGVEDEDAWELLCKIGCDVAQGYYFARPLPAPELTRWLADADVPTTRPTRRVGSEASLV